MTRRSKEEIYLGIAVTGFFMPVLQLADSSITYALTQTSQLVTKTTIAAAPLAAPSLTSLGTSIALIFLVIAILGVLQDFESGLQMKYKALLFNIGAIVGLYVFWNPLSNITTPIPHFLYARFLNFSNLSLNVGLWQKKQKAE